MSPNSHSATMFAECPFCGADSLHIKPEFVPNTQGARKFLSCMECHAQGPWSTKAINEVDGWDMRVPKRYGPEGEAESMRVTLGCCLALMAQSGDERCLEMARRIPFTIKNGEPYALVGAPVSEAGKGDGWTACGDKLPETSGFYLIWDAIKKRVGILYYHDHRLVQMPMSMPVWTYSDEQPWNGYFTVGVEITHWKKQPAGPQPVATEEQG